MDLRGPTFESWDRRALLVHLVRAGLAEAVCFPSKGSTVPPTEVLHKKAAVLAPGYFGHTDPAHSTYNTFNHTQFTSVNTSAQFNPATGAQTNASFGQFTGTASLRFMQLAGRINF